MLLGMAFVTPAYVSAQTRGLGCSHEHTASAYSRTGQEVSYTYIVEKKVNGNPAFAVSTLVEETLYYKVKCNDCGAELP